MASAAFCLLVGGSRLFADGNETIAPIAEISVADGDTILAAGIGLEKSQPMKIVLDVPQGTGVKQVFLYWGLRSSAGDSSVRVNNISPKVDGRRIGASTNVPEERAFVFRADITDLGLIKAGRNEVAISDLVASGDGGVPNGAGIIVIGDAGTGAHLELRDGCDFVFWRFTDAQGSTVRQKFTFAPAAMAREARLTMFVGDHTPPGAGETNRPSSLEIRVNGGPVQKINDPLQGANGASWDTLRIPVAIPAGATMVEAQFFSDTSRGTNPSPSSFYWVFGSIEVPGSLTISGTVYCDDDGDSERDPGEMGISGVEVAATCTLGGQMRETTTFTDDEGRYRIDGVEPGSDCSVDVVPSAALMDKEPTEVCPEHEDIRAPVEDCDFGFAKPPVVGDTVFLDSNGDGAQQAGEPGLSGVKVMLTVPAGGGFPGRTDMQTTDGDGKYLFRIPGVPAGARVVATVEIDPATGGAAGKDLTTPNPQQTIPLGLGGMDLARDFGLEPRSGDATVGDTVFRDDDGNGRLDPGEPGLSGVEVSLSCPAGNGFPGHTADANTDSSGRYLFTVPGIPDGVTVVCGVGIDPQTGEAAGKDLTTQNPQNTRALGPGGSDLDRDFGLRTRAGDAEVGDTVFCDLNGNGRQDGTEPGIEDVTVQLSAPAAGSFPGSNQTTTTGNGGKYSFTLSGIPSGTTVVARVSLDRNSPALQGKTLTTPDPQDTRPLGPGDEDLDRDFGLEPNAARVGDTVFLDENGNGVQESAEPGIPGVSVRLEIPATGLFGGFNQNATTDSSGKYLFAVEGIPPDTPLFGDVEIDPETGGAAGKVLTTPNPQRTIELGPGVSDLNRDFGLRAEEVIVKTCIESKSLREGECADFRVLLTSNQPVEGFVTAIRHDSAALTLDSITTAGTATETNLADFKSFEVLPTGGTAAVVMDLETPFLGNTIPAGTSVPIVLYRYCCKPLPAGSGQRMTRLEFVQNELGSPPKENAIVVGGRSFTPEFCGGDVTCLPDEEPPMGPCFLCGGPELGPDRLPVPPRGAPGERVELCFWYCSPEDNASGHQQFDHIQGLSMAICHDCRLTCVEGSFRVPEDSMLDAIGAEFVDFQCEGDAGDGDGCEMIFGVLVDALPPFDGQTLPPTEIPLKLFCVDVIISEDAACECLPVQFCDGADGRGNVPIKNVYSAENKSFPPITVDCAVCVTGRPMFRRGDCNADGKANLPDAASVVSFLFAMMGNFDPPCLDACDANDDGRVDVADAIRILHWLFVDASPPPAPGPNTPGLDPTVDKLPTCEGGPCE